MESKSKSKVNIKKTNNYNKRRGNRVRNTGNSVSRRVRLGDFGFKVTPPTNPPDTTAHPWYPLIISAIRGPGNYTIDNLCEDFQNQMNADKFTFNSNSYNSDSGVPFRIQFRFIGVDVWNLTGRIISLTVWEIPEQSYTEDAAKFAEKDQLGSWVDCGGPSAFPAVGYRYPASHHRRIYRPDPRYADKIIFSAIGASSDKVLVHLHLMWKSDGYPKFNTVQHSYVPILNQIKKTNENLVSINKSILKQQGSTAGKIIDGVSVAAQYVIPLATGSCADVAHTVVSDTAAKDEQIASLMNRLSILEQQVNAQRSGEEKNSELNSDCSFIDEQHECEEGVEPIM